MRLLVLVLATALLLCPLALGLNSGDPVYSFSFNTSGANVTNGEVLTAYSNAQVSSAQYKLGNASALLDGADDIYRNLGGSTPPFSLTISAWVRPDAFNVRGNIFTWSDAGAAINTNLGINTSGHPYFQWAAQSGNYVIHTSEVALKTGRWSHVVVRVTGTGTPEIWVNGTNTTLIRKTLGDNSNRPYSNLPYAIGGWPEYGIGGGDIGTFDGYIDEVAVFPSYIATSDIAILWNSGTGTHYPYSEAPNAPTINISIINRTWADAWFWANATDPTGSNLTYHYELFRNGALLSSGTGATLAYDSGLLSYFNTTRLTSDGEYFLRVIAENNNSLNSSYRDSVNLTVASAALLTVTAWNDTSDNKQLGFNVSINDPDNTTIANLTMMFYVNGINVANQTNTSVANDTSIHYSLTQTYFVAGDVINASFVSNDGSFINTTWSDNTVITAGLPNINDVTISPTSTQAATGSVNILTNCTSESYSVSAIKAQITDPNGLVVNYSMSPLLGDTFDKDYVPGAVGVYNVTIYCEDSNNNISYSSDNTFSATSGAPSGGAPSGGGGGGGEVIIEGGFDGEEITLPAEETVLYVSPGGRATGELKLTNDGPLDITLAISLDDDSDSTAKEWVSFDGLKSLSEFVVPTGSQLVSNVRYIRFQAEVPDDALLGEYVVLLRLDDGVRVATHPVRVIVRKGFFAWVTQIWNKELFMLGGGCEDVFSNDCTPSASSSFRTKHLIMILALLTILLLFVRYVNRRSKQ